MEPKRIAVIPYRYRNGRVEVLLVTSRGTGRWIVPKGHVEPHLGPRGSALLEAYEEAGVEGRITIDVLGTYLHGPEPVKQEVDVYLMHVSRELRQWPEAGVRSRKWLPIKEAMKVVTENGLVPLLHIAAEVLV